MIIGRTSAVVVAALAACAVCADTPPPTRANFVSCPIVRDTKTVPCWLSEYEGELYYLGIQTDISADFDPPYLGHRVLVEGTVTDQPRICGGIVLEPVIVSPLAELDRTCSMILPAEDRYTVPFAPRPPGPSGGRLAFERPAAPAPTLEPPFDPKEFVIYHDFAMLALGRDSRTLGQILSYAQTVDARRVTVTGYSGATLLSNGKLMQEDGGLAEKRAEQIADLLQRGGLGELEFEVHAMAAAEPADGIDDWRSRRTVVRVEP